MKTSTFILFILLLPGCGIDHDVSGEVDVQTAYDININWNLDLLFDDIDRRLDEQNERLKDLERGQ